MQYEYIYRHKLVADNARRAIERRSACATFNLLLRIFYDDECVSLGFNAIVQYTQTECGE